jgi:hypothetical protein
MNAAIRNANTRQVVRRLIWQARAVVIRQQLIAMRSTTP